MGPHYSRRTRWRLHVSNPGAQVTAGLHAGVEGSGLVPFVLALQEKVELLLCFCALDGPPRLVGWLVGAEPGCVPNVVPQTTPTALPTHRAAREKGGGAYHQDGAEPLSQKKLASFDFEILPICILDEGAVF